MFEQKNIRTVLQVPKILTADFQLRKITTYSTKMIFMIVQFLNTHLTCKLQLLRRQTSKTGKNGTIFGRQITGSEIRKLISTKVEGF